MFEVKVDVRLVLLTILTIITLRGVYCFVLQLDEMAFVCPLVLITVPIGLVIYWISNRRFFHPHNRQHQTIKKWLVIFNLIGLVPSFFPGLFWIGIWLHVIEPWPLSTFQGPDTKEAITGFQKIFGAKASEDIHAIFYKGYEIRDYSRFLKFSSCLEGTAVKIFSGLESQAPSIPPPHHLDSNLHWWFSQTEASRLDHWVKPGGFFEVWRNPETCTFYVRSWTN